MRRVALVQEHTAFRQVLEIPGGLREERQVLVEDLERERRERLNTRPAAERPQEQAAHNGGSDVQRVSG